jgi:hypothetical protein
MKRGDLWSMGVLPILAAGALAGFFGLYWDISWHIDKGRDTFFTPPHDFVYTGLLTVLAAAAYGLWRDRRDTPFHLRAGKYRLHLGVLIVAAGAALVLMFAPLDDLWHRWFGVDVTLWGPMHLIGLLGLAVGRFGGLVCAWIERGLTDDPRRRRLFGDLTLYFAAMLLAGVVVVTGEYEFVVPQFPMVLHPVLIAALPVFPLLLIARLAPRPFSATLTAVVFTVLRLLLAGWLVAASYLDLGGVSKPAIPLLIATGFVTDLIAARDSKGWASGAAAGAVTLLVNLTVIDLWGPAAGGIRLFWTAGTIRAALVPALVLSAVMGAAASAVAACFGARAKSHPAVVDRALVHAALVAVVAAGALASAVVPPADAAARSNGPVTARITIAHRSPGRPSLVTVQIDPPAAPRGGELLLSIYRPGVIVNRRVLEPAGPGAYRAEYPFPVDGVWRYYLRFGPGQAGFAGAGYISIANVAGASDHAQALMRSGLRRAPPYVQTLGYAAFGLAAALAITGIAIVLARMRLVYSPRVPS